MTLRLLGKLAAWLVAIAAVGCLTAVVAIVSLPKVMGWTGVVVLSGSMEPALKTGGIAFVEPVKNTSQVRVGDMLTHTSPDFGDSRVTHRVIEVLVTDEGPAFVTKGDANAAADPSPVPSSRVIGVVKYHIPYLGYVVDKLRQRDNFYLFIGLPAAVLILNELYSVVAELRKPRGAKAVEAQQEPEGVSS